MELVIYSPDAYHRQLSHCSDAISMLSGTEVASKISYFIFVPRLYIVCEFSLKKKYTRVNG